MYNFLFFIIISNIIFNGNGISFPQKQYTVFLQKSQ